MRIRFSKYEGAGNDFILVDNRDSQFLPTAQLIQNLCDRHFGIGADGLMTLSRSTHLDCSMRYFNADGSEGEMCGNGARCIALFAHHLGIGGERKYFDAADGEHQAQILSTQGAMGDIELGMNEVTRINISNGTWSLNTGVPHYVEFTDNLTEINILDRGPQIRHDTTRFPEGTNVNFVEILGEGSIKMRTYERGVEAETLACGTGATAAAIVTNYAHQHDRTNYRIQVPGGKLTVCFAHIPGTQTYTDIRLTGPARRVFEGEFNINNF